MTSPNAETSRLVLGTAQFGEKYGVANRMGKPDTATAESIVEEAWKGGIREFDTAQGYGDSEIVLGKALNSLGIAADVKIISKFHPRLKHSDSVSLRQALEQTLVHLGVPRLYGLMLHREDLLDLWDRGLKETFMGFLNDGLTEHLGVSVYTPEKAIQALKTDGIHLVQVPSNLLDRRFEKAGVFSEAARCGKGIYVRSVFLQGLLIMNVRDLPESMRFATSVIKRLVTFAEKTGFSLKQLALGYVRSAYPANKVLFGSETVQQVRENLTLWSTQLPLDVVAKVRREFGNVPEKILNPTLWENIPRPKRG
jgi:aryl-alcohol dehydrogenase-like predicted oxidoreductase